MSEIPSIQSVANSMVKHAHSLTVPKKARESDDFLCEGFHLVVEAFKSSLRVRFVFMSAKAMARPEGKSILESAHREKVKIFEVPDKIIGYLSETAAPQGVVAVAGKPVIPRPEVVSNCVLALHQVQDPGNVGTLIRSAEAFGTDVVFLTQGSCDPFNPKVVRASMGSIFRIPLEQGLSSGTIADWAKNKGLLQTALVQDSDHDLDEVPKDKPVLFWAGAEGQGLPAEITDHCDLRVRIPMTGSVDSLNVAVAGSLALFSKGFRRSVS